MKLRNVLLLGGVVLALPLSALAQAPARAPAAAPATPSSAAAAASTAASASPVAEAPPAPAAPALGEALTGPAKQDYESGRLLFRDGDHAGALAKFRSAYDASKDPRLLWNMAACEKNLRHYAKAVGLVRRYLKEGDATLPAEDKADATELVKVMEPFTAKLRITVSEPGAELTLDGEPLGPSPVAPVVVDMGVRKLVVRKAGFEELTREIAVGGAAELAAEVTLVKIVHQGRLTIRAPKDATLTLDGKVVGSGTWSGTVASGGHTLQVTAPKMRLYQSEVIVLDKQTREVGVTLEAEPSKGLPGWVWVAGGVVVAGGLATAGYFLFKPSPAYDGPPGNLDPGVVQAGAPFTFR
jgi:hypothetical protein